MAFCSKCGHQVDDNSKFCAFCGAIQAQAQQQNQAQQPPEQQYSFNDTYDCVSEIKDESEIVYKGPEAFEMVRARRGVYGLGKGITSVIMAFVAIIFAICTLAFAAEAEYYYDLADESEYSDYDDRYGDISYGGGYYEDGYYYTYYVDNEATAENFEAVTIVFAFLTFALTSVSVAMGIMAVLNYVKAKTKLGTNPVATLILGIAGLSLSLIDFIMIIASIALL